MGEDLVTTKGLELDDLGVGDIVTVSARGNDRSYHAHIFEVLAATSAAVALTVRWDGEGIYAPVGSKRVFRRRDWRFFEASDLLEAVTDAE